MSKPPKYHTYNSLTTYWLCAIHLLQPENGPSPGGETQLWRQDETGNWQLGGSPVEMKKRIWMQLVSTQKTRRIQTYC